MTALLAVEGLTKRFAGLLAVDQVSLEVAAGEIFAVIGPNGAGKTTLFAMIAGAITPDEGTVWFDGVRVDRLTPDAVCRRGIGRTFQIVRPFPALSVEDNVAIGAALRRPDMASARAHARDILAALDLADKRTLPAASLTLPDRKRLEVARALATGPKLLLLDEVMAGLRPAETDRMVAILQQTQSRYRHHHPADRTRHARRDGAGRPGPGAASWQDNRRRNACRGGARSGGHRLLSRRRGDGLMLTVRELDVFHGDVQALDGVSFDVPEGKIVAIVGANGAGKTSLIRAIAGMLRPWRGRITFRETDITGWPSHRVCNTGIGQVAEGRQVFPMLTVRENLEVAALLPRARRNRAQNLAQVLAMFPILAERAGQAAGTLSGGEQQMLAIGRCLMGRPDLIMFDEPSLGLAPAIVQSVLATIRDLNRDGLTCILVEQNVALSLRLADRAYVLENGRITISGTGAELLADDRVRQAYLGM